jgi:hypothetical protein
VALEDGLLQLAVEGGGYCARGIKRVSSNMITEQLLPHLRLKKLGSAASNLDPIKAYELNLLQSLQNVRGRAVESFYAKITEEFPSTLKSDVHIMDLYKIALMTGLMPLTENERWNFDLSAYQIWKVFNQMDEMSRDKNYKSILNIDSPSPMNESPITAIGGDIKCVEYLQGLFGSNPKLSAEDRTRLDDLLQEVSFEKWRKLVYVMLGVLRKKAA